MTLKLGIAIPSTRCVPDPEQVLVVGPDGIEGGLLVVGAGEVVVVDAVREGRYLNRAATEFFALQAVVIDAAWTLSAGPDAARLNALQGNEITDDVARQRWSMNQALQATLRNQAVADAFSAVSFMVAHPSILADPALLDLAVQANDARTGDHHTDNQTLTVKR